MIGPQWFRELTFWFGFIMLLYLAVRVLLVALLLAYDLVDALAYRLVVRRIRHAQARRQDEPSQDDTA